MDLTTLEVFAADVGGVDDGPVTCVGGRSQWEVGGRCDPSAREVRAPSGITDYEPAEMIVRCGAGTRVADLNGLLAAAGQMVALDPACPDVATVGGVLAVGHSGLRRLRFGPLRDVLLEAKFVAADGSLIKAGGPVVKNVTGFDLCRVLVGSLGTIGFLAEVVLRCQPRPPVSSWFRSGRADPFDVRRRLFRPSSILTDGQTTWVLLEGRSPDVEAELERLNGDWHPAEGPPPLPSGGRESLPPSALRTLEGQYLAEIGVGTVHRPHPVPAVSVHGRAAELQRRVRDAFDPSRRLNPGRMEEAA